MKRRELEMTLQRLEGFEKPDPALEQYPTPAVIAADALYFAAGSGDIEGKRVVDLGCGTGVLALGAALLGAAEVVAVDADDKAIDIAMRNAVSLDCDIELVHESVDGFRGGFDTCIQNPPFGAQNRHADMPFLRKAMEIADVVYSFHNSVTDRFIRREVKGLGGVVSSARTYDFEIRHTFDFHRKEKETVPVNLYRIVKGGG